MRIVSQKIMNQLFDTVDAIPLSREAIEVPLAMEGAGRVRKLPSGRFEITLPDTDDLGPFLAALAAELRALGLPEGGG